MTPPPITFAGKDGASTGHRRGVRKRTAPTAPRRVSGPKAGRTAASRTAKAATAGRTAAPRTAKAATAGGAPRTTARPSTKTARRRLVPRLAPFAPRRTSTRVRPTGPLPARALAYVRALPDHPLLDRIIRGRTWIAMLGVMLVGIVAMQVEELKLGASVGRGLSESAALQSKNQLLRATVSALADDQRIERLAAGMGMVMPAPGDVLFLTPHTSVDAARAARQIQAPNPASFLASLPQTTASSATGATGLAVGTTAGTTPLTSSATATGAATSTGTVAPSGTATSTGATGTAAGTAGTTATGTATVGTTGTTGTGATGGTASPPVGTTATGAVALAPVSAGSGTTGG